MEVPDDTLVKMAADIRAVREAMERIAAVVTEAGAHVGPIVETVRTQGVMALLGGGGPTPLGPLEGGLFGG